MKNHLKIAIVTLRLHTNYGGLLQAFALQHTLKGMGHEVYTIRRDTPRHLKFLGAIKRFLDTYVLRRSNRAVCKHESELEKNTKIFRNKNITLTKETARTKADLSRLHGKYKFDAYVVGSDQVWRPAYNPRITDFFLDFIPKTGNTSPKKISYAASFGSSDWEFSPALTKKCGELLKQFNSVSVRESSGVVLCKSHFEVDAKHVLDPTLLLNKETYMQTVDKETSFNGDILTYILDPTKEKKQIVAQVKSELGLTDFTVMPQEILSKNTKDIEKCIYPPVTDWLQGFDKAKFVVTDSFHGCVFSIIFNVPFIAIANKARGIDRFTSLLDMFDLRDRLVSSESEVSDSLINDPVNWEHINSVLEEKRKSSMDFLIESLA